MLSLKECVGQTIRLHLRIQPGQLYTVLPELLRVSQSWEVLEYRVWKAKWTGESIFASLEVLYMLVWDFSGSAPIGNSLEPVLFVNKSPWQEPHSALNLRQGLLTAYKEHE